ncbi:MAG: chromate efflux transporter [Opitutaceae bacterium]|tara:strand:+ start:2040 stop:3233 length:1194 start_codon:yes stop_codon:yes gene_type:complete
MKTVPPTAFNRPIDVLFIFLRLGCVCFGGPVAHLGYFREEFVERRRWLSDAEYADLVALCQFLPGPASSQVGYALGLRQAGFCGGAAAWLGFTLPSAALMIGFALGLSSLGSLESAGWVVGLKLVAVAVVAHALWGMAVKLCPDWQRQLMAAFTCGWLLTSYSVGGQVVVILLGALVGRFWFRDSVGDPAPITQGKSPKSGLLWLALFFAGLIGLPLLALGGGETIAIIDGFYRAGSLVFGGGHVVLPLLDAFTVGRDWITQDVFLAGYGAAQALPGPLFAFTAFLGSSVSIGPGGVGGGVLALVATYVPSLLLILGVMPYWDRLRAMPAAQAALLGANAIVVGLLAAALVNPIGIHALTEPLRLVFAAIAFAALKFTKFPVWALVGVGAVVGQVVL